VKERVIPPVGGARNPYVVAEHQFGKKIEWQKFSSTERKNILENAMRMPYSKIFSSDPESPLFRLSRKRSQGGRQ
jgi:hypothetical protein